MQIITSLEEFKTKSSWISCRTGCRRTVFRCANTNRGLTYIKNVSSHCFLFESVENQEIWGRYTFLGFDPKEEIAFTGGKNPRGRIEEVLKEYKSPRMENLHPYRRISRLFFL